MKPLHRSPQVLSLVVLRHGADWRIFGPEGPGRRFAHRVDAEEAALRLARETFETMPVEVLVQDHGGELHLLSRMGRGWAAPNPA
ncbi:MAG: hypothetical protein SWI22_01050 [Pseudomonadota bacterium]|nr:hypothetical protein [Pseudomonadota bacterium]